MYWEMEFLIYHMVIEKLDEWCNTVFKENVITKSFIVLVVS